MALGPTQPLTEMSSSSISWGGKGGRCVRLTTYHHPVPLSQNLGTLTSWNPLGSSGPVMGLIYLSVTLLVLLAVVMVVLVVSVRQWLIVTSHHVQLSTTCLIWSQMNAKYRNWKSLLCFYWAMLTELPTRAHVCSAVCRNTCLSARSRARQSRLYYQPTWPHIQYGVADLLVNFPLLC